VTISGGVACFPADADDSVELLRNADTALYQAKSSGRNKVFRAQAAGLNPDLGEDASSVSDGAGSGAEAPRERHIELELDDEHLA
jgi:hypothetical protein